MTCYIPSSTSTSSSSIPSSYAYLHKPTFLQNLAAGLHLSDTMFGALVLAVCTVAATHGSEDPRVMTEGYPLPFSRDLKYATQVWQIRKRLYEPLSLHEVQLLCVATTIRIQYNWAGEQIHFMIGATLRCMQGA